MHDGDWKIGRFNIDYRAHLNLMAVNMVNVTDQSVVRSLLIMQW